MAKRSAGTLDRRITIERKQATSTNAFNEEVVSWSPFLTVWAARHDVSDGEKLAAGSIGSFLRTRFVIRATSLSRSVTPVDRISYAGAVWNIHGVKEADRGDMRGRFIEITAVKEGL